MTIGIAKIAPGIRNSRNGTVASGKEAIQAFLAGGRSHKVLELAEGIVEQGLGPLGDADCHAR